MVRAAASGAVDYSGADPLNKNWRIKHRLLLAEVHRQEEHRLLEHVHQHWCAYLAHGSLEPDSFKRVKDSTGQSLTHLQNVIFPWDSKPEVKTESTAQKSTIDPETQRLIDRYKALTSQNPASG
jgi:hypothetical protein